ncbi:RloB family protein [Bacillus thuringiensis]|uniref:RloB family protein n=1 Tax=Bacillus thuringiensis TaxID=1428 RepID=UPI000CF9999F|nr:RloB family protein [Bacillus thuringiensis]PQQ47017.1 hypothetical protein C6A34_13540 [Bacillus thuringiensis]
MARSRKLSRVEEKSVRRSGFRSQNPTVLVVCEGEETEIKYFSALKKIYRGFGIDIKPTNTKFTDALNIVNNALLQMEKHDINLQEGDTVWCVVDVDKNTTNQLNAAKKIADDNGMSLILSNPCFEIWYLLHKKYTTSAYSNSDQVIVELEKNGFPKYAKNKDVYPELEKSETTAIQNAIKLKRFHEADGNNLYSKKSNPSTAVYEVLEHLYNKKTK